MRNLYARFVLWLIRPALLLSFERDRADYDSLAVALKELAEQSFKGSPKVGKR